MQCWAKILSACLILAPALFGTGHYLGWTKGVRPRSTAEWFDSIGSRSLYTGEVMERVWRDMDAAKPVDIAAIVAEVAREHSEWTVCAGTWQPFVVNPDSEAWKDTRGSKGVSQILVVSIGPFYLEHDPDTPVMGGTDRDGVSVPIRIGAAPSWMSRGLSSRIGHSAP